MRRTAEWRSMNPLKQQLGSHFVGAPPLETVFFGGGTPSLIPPPLLQEILDALHSKFGIADDAEISMEADPGVPSPLPPHRPPNTHTCGTSMM